MQLKVYSILAGFLSTSLFSLKRITEMTSNTMTRRRRAVFALKHLVATLLSDMFGYFAFFVLTQ